MGGEEIKIMSGDNFKKIGSKEVAVSNQGEYGFATLPRTTTKIPLMHESDHITSVLETYQGSPFPSASKPRSSEESMRSAVFCFPIGLNSCDCPLGPLPSSHTAFLADMPGMLLPQPWLFPLPGTCSVSLISFKFDRNVFSMDTTLTDL